MTFELPSQPQGRSLQPGDKAHVLLIYEEPDGLVYNSMLLQRLGCEVLPCWSYTDGLQDMDRESWDFIVVSQGTRAFDGRCILEHATDLNRKVPILVLASSHDMHCYLEAMQLGAVDYLEEPVSFYEMKRVLDSYLPMRLPPVPGSQP